MTFKSVAVAAMAVVKVSVTALPLMDGEPLSASDSAELPFVTVKAELTSDVALPNSSLKTSASDEPLTQASTKVGPTRSWLR